MRNEPHATESTDVESAGEDPLEIAKDALRQCLLAAPETPASPAPAEGWGKAAERLRRLPAYRHARCILVSPDRRLLQVRLNALSDQKWLLLPTFGLQKGFLLLNPRTLAPGRRRSAVMGLVGPPSVQKAAYNRPLPEPVQLIITDSLAVGTDGSRLGDGMGHLDLQVAILEALRWLHPKTQVITLIESSKVLATVPMRDTDVVVHWIVTPDELAATTAGPLPSLPIRWERLSTKQIRRNDALFFLNRQ